MKILPQPISFEWDGGNLDKNWLQHDVSNQEAEEVFFNEPAAIFSDEKHSSAENRFMIWGMTNKGRKLTAIFTIRKNRVRVISARDMNKKERRAYEEIKNNSAI